MSSEDVYKGGKRADLDVVVVLNIDIRSEGDAEELHIVTGNGHDLMVEKGDDGNVCD